MYQRRGTRWRVRNPPSLGLLLLLLSQWLCTAVVYAVEGCPPGCTCENIASEGDGVSGFRTTCIDLWLEVLPQEIPKNTTVLDFSSNDLKFIQNRTFAHLPNLTSLNLDSNLITTLRPGAFEGLSQLRNLSMRSNMIEELPAGVFSGLHSLETLSLYRNDLDIVVAGVFMDLPNIVDIDLSSNRLIVLPDDSFNGLQRLQRLTLNRNHLQRLGQRAFCNLTSLIYLNLAQNDLTGVPEGVICGLANITTFIISENPIRCTCEALWLYNWLRERMLTTAVCVLPPDLRDTNLLSLEQSRFCEPPTVTISSSATVLTSGSFLSMTCLTTGRPQPQVTWSKNGRRISPEGERVMVRGSVLQIERLAQQDSGLYFCSATSEAGTAVTSQNIAVIDVAMELSLPSPTIMTGSSAQLTCSSSLSSLTNITITWTFSPTSSSSSVTLPSSARHLVLSDGSLLVSSAVLQDTGEYICNISDGANAIVQLSRMLSVTAPPTIRMFPEPQCRNDTSIRLDSNMPHELFCEADGNPVPFVQWVRANPPEGGGTGLPSVSSSEQDFTARAVLNFTMPSLEQSGLYTCIANSSLGRDTRTIRVLVRVLAGVNETLLGSRTILAGQDLLLSCGSINPSEVTSLMWRKEDGSPFPGDAVTAINGSLFIPTVEVGDRGVYQCHLDTGTAQTTLKYNITVAAVPVISAQSGRPPVIPVLIDNTATLFCNVTSFPPATLAWFKDGQRIEQVLNSSDYRLVDGGRELVFTELEDEYSGVYMCVASNALGNSSHTVVLDVQRRPFFRSTPENLQVIEKETAVLRCSAGGNPTPTVQWWKVRTDGQSIRLSENQHVVISNEFLALVTVHIGSAGQYFCTINSSLGMRESPRVHLTVYTRPRIIVKPPTSLAVNEGSSITFPCQAVGDPQPAIGWFRNQTFLPLPGIHTLDSAGLRLIRARPEDEGNYTCVAVNLAGREEAKIRLTVIRVPNVSVTPPTLTLNLGCTASFTCLDHNVIPGEFTWLLPNRQLSLNSSRVTVTVNGGLMVSGLLAEDTGNYTCVVRTSAGEHRAVSTLRVEDSILGSAAMPPAIVSLTPTVQTIPVGLTAQFVCQTTGVVPPPPISWVRNGARVPNLARITISQGLLTIRDVRTTDAGSYSCMAFTSSGNITATFQLMVATRPSINRLPMPLSVMEVDPIVLRCDATGNPSPEILWLFNGLTLGPSDGAIIENLNTMSTLSIFNTTTRNSGLYTCVARNSAGTVEHTVTVSVQEPTSPPFINSPAVGRRIGEGNPFRIDCLAVGQPTPTVTWFRDGVRIVNSSRVQVDSRSVLVTASTVTDSGVYLCVANNSAGMTSHSLDMDIRIREVLPFFPMLPTAVSAIVGDDIYINCASEGTPTPDLEFFNGNLTKIFSSRFTTFPNGTIIIRDARESDTGDYLCEASNTAGHSRVWFTITVRVAAVFPNFTHTLVGAVTTELNFTTFLHCQASGAPPPVITWLRFGVPISTEGGEGGGEERLSVFPNGTLRILRTELLDDGLYVCDATNEAGSIRQAVTLKVEDRSSPASGASLQDVTLLSRSHVVLPCPHRHNPLSVWMKNGDLLYNGNGSTVDSDGTLMIPTALANHAGRYTCAIATSHGVLKNSAMLRVVERKEPPYFTIHPSDTHVVVGHPLVLHCSPGGPRPIARTWLYKGEVLQGEGGRVVFLNNGETLVIGRPVLGDSGTYTCQASNAFGMSEAPAEVKVHTHPINVSVSLLIGGSTQLTCAPHINTGSPVVWYQNGNLVLPSFKMLSSGRFLWLFGVSADEEGDYTCSTTSGSVIETHYVDVLIPPRILHTTPVAVPNYRDDVSVDCKATGSPRPIISWWNRNKPLSLSNKYSIFHNGTLVIHQTTPLDTGAYFCRAANIIGHSQGRSFVLVRT